MERPLSEGGVTEGWMLPTGLRVWHYMRDGASLCYGIRYFGKAFEDAIKANCPSVGLPNCERCLDGRLADMNGLIDDQEILKTVTSPQRELFQ